MKKACVVCREVIHNRCMMIIINYYNSLKRIHVHATINQSTIIQKYIRNESLSIKVLEFGCRGTTHIFISCFQLPQFLIYALYYILNSPNCTLENNRKTIKLEYVFEHSDDPVIQQYIHNNNKGKCGVKPRLQI